MASGANSELFARLFQRGDMGERRIGGRDTDSLFARLLHRSRVLLFATRVTVTVSTRSTVPGRSLSSRIHAGQIRRETETLPRPSAPAT